VCLAMRDTMRSLELRYPDGDPGIAALKVK
jgi:hypothetical protein